MKKVGMWIGIIVSILIFGAFFGAMGYFIGVVLVPIGLNLMKRYFQQVGMRWPRRFILAGVIVLLWMLTVGPWLNRQLYAHVPIARHMAVGQKVAFDLFLGRKTYEPGLAQEVSLMRFAVDIDSIEARIVSDTLAELREKWRAGYFTRADQEKLNRLVTRVRQNKRLAKAVANAKDPREDAIVDLRETKVAYASEVVGRYKKSFEREMEDLLKKDSSGVPDIEQLRELFQLPLEAESLYQSVTVTRRGVTQLATFSVAPQEAPVETPTVPTPSNGPITLNASIPSFSEVNGVPFFQLFITKMERSNETVRLTLEWSNPSGDQTASVNKLTTLTDDLGRTYELVATDGVPLASYERPVAKPVRSEGVVRATLLFRATSDGTVDPKTVREYTIHFKDVYVQSRVWEKTFAVPNIV